MALSDNIRRCREVAQLSQGELAKRCGIDQSAVCKMEKGLFVPTVMVLDEIANALNVSLDELVRGKGA